MPHIKNYFSMFPKPKKTTKKKQLYIKRGKRTLAWDRCRAKLKKLYQEKNITTCEVSISNKCFIYSALSFAHRHKRAWYLNHPELLGEFNQTVLCCIVCHQFIEPDPQLTESIFQKLRGTETTS